MPDDEQLYQSEKIGFDARKMGSDMGDARWDGQLAKVAFRMLTFDAVKSK